MFNLMKWPILTHAFDLRPTFPLMFKRKAQLLENYLE
jgi:hypothetical protein